MEKSPRATSATAEATERRALLLVYLLAGVIGAGLGARDLVPFGRLLPGGSSTPLARVGAALGPKDMQASPSDWAALERDLDTVRRTFASAEPGALELVLALRGVTSGGNPDFARAEQVCRELKWRRCSRPALDVMQKRARP